MLNFGKRFFGRVLNCLEAFGHQLLVTNFWSVFGRVLSEPQLLVTPIGMESVVSCGRGGKVAWTSSSSSSATSSWKSNSCSRGAARAEFWRSGKVAGCAYWRNPFQLVKVGRRTHPSQRQKNFCCSLDFSEVTQPNIVNNKAIE